MSTATASMAGSDAARRLGLGDENKFVTLRRIPIFSTHEPKVKTVRDRDKADETHPGGVVPEVMTCDPEDLADLARNSNRRAETGRPAVLQIGHTVLGNSAPESEQPKAVGVLNNFDVGELDGEPTLFADMHYRREHHDEAVTYPRLSIERAGFRDPNLHAVSAVALIRRKPEIDLPMVPYQAESPFDQLVCYGAERPSPLLRDDDLDMLTGDALVAPPDPPEVEPETDFDPDPRAPETPPMAELETPPETISPAMMTAIHECVAKTVATILAATKEPAEVSGEATTTPTPETSNYNASPAGTNTGYIPDAGADEMTKEEMADYAKTCYAAEIAPVLDLVKSQAREIEGLKAQLTDTNAKVVTLTNAAEDAMLTAERSNYSRIIDDAEKANTVIDEESRAILIETIYALPSEKREAALRKQLANYARSSIGDGFIPGPSRMVGAVGDSDEAERQKRMTWMGARGLRGDSGRQAYATAKANGKV